jgi:hypothetical protein
VVSWGQSLKLSIQGGNDTNGIAALYVNGRRISETVTEANSTTVVEIPAASLTAMPGEKNVIEVQIEKPDGTINASRYVAVRSAGYDSVVASVAQSLENVVSSLHNALA